MYLHMWYENTEICMSTKLIFKLTPHLMLQMIICWGEIMYIRPRFMNKLNTIISIL